jgi:hypothetical protein
MVTMCVPEFCQGDDIRERGTAGAATYGPAPRGCTATRMARKSDFADEFFERAHVS